MRAVPVRTPRFKPGDVLHIHPLGMHLYDVEHRKKHAWNYERRVIVVAMTSHRYQLRDHAPAELKRFSADNDDFSYFLECRVIDERWDKESE